MDPTSFKAVMSRWASGVSVVTTGDSSGRMGGFTASSFTSLSLNPPLILVCLANNSTNFELFIQSKRFAVHILAEHQESLSQQFAKSGEDKFTDVAYTTGIEGVPILEGCLGVLECESQQNIPGGDHVILIGKPVSASFSEQSSLVYYLGGYHSL